MLQALSAAKTGLTAQQRRVDTIANNLANISTNGYKADSVRFKDALYVTMQRPVQPQTGQDLQLGTGVLVASTARSYSQGSPVESEEALDLCLLGDGFFTVEAAGEIQYTRDGCFGLVDQYLVTAQGFYVLDENQQRISLDPQADLSINEAGELVQSGQLLARLNLVSFSNNDGLESVSQNCFRATELSGPPQASQATVRQGWLESANVDLAREMTRLIRAQRCYSLASRAVTTLDDMQATTNNLRQ